jgi:GH15 family glucan-1,4-alpha-glucosidase
MACQISDEIRRFILDVAQPHGHLPKFVGSDTVDASLLWACVPFGLLPPNHPLMTQTVARIRADLVGPHGGVHRYARDSYYGGGAWLLLTALLGEYLLQVGEPMGARDALRWIEEQARGDGAMPEQVPLDLNEPAMYDPWVERWGPVALPLLWSHAAYLRLRGAIDNPS